MDATQKTVTSIELTDGQRQQIAKDLGLANRMEKVPTSIAVAGLKSAHLKGVVNHGGAPAAVAVIA